MLTHFRLGLWDYGLFSLPQLFVLRVVVPNPQLSQYDSFDGAPAVGFYAT